MNASTTLRRAKKTIKRYVDARPPVVDAETTPRAWRRLRHFGLGHECPACESRVAKFLPVKAFVPRNDAVCPVCGSTEWYRLGWWFLSTKHAELIQPGKRVMHIAAEPELRRQFLSVDNLTYVALDLDPRRATAIGDLLRLPFADGAFDLVYCSHVLEHVDDEHAAMRELRRVTSPSGAALIQVPITAEKTWGDPSITDPAERERLFGQNDHVRVFGYDVIDALTNAGWNVEAFRADSLPADVLKRYGFPHHDVCLPAQDIFWCTPR